MLIAVTCAEAGIPVAWLVATMCTILLLGLVKTINSVRLLVASLSVCTIMDHHAMYVAVLQTLHK